MAQQTGSVFSIINDFASPASGTVDVPTDAQISICIISGYVGTANWLQNATLTLGGQAFVDVTAACTDGQTSLEQIYIGYLVGPPTGSQTFSATWTGTTSEGPNFKVLHLLGIDTGTPIGSAGVNTSGNASFTISGLTASAGDFTIGVHSNFNQFGTLSGGSQISQTNTSNGSYLTINGGDAVTSYSFTGGNFSSGSAFVVRNAAASGSFIVGGRLNPALLLH